MYAWRRAYYYCEGIFNGVLGEKMKIISRRTNDFVQNYTPLRTEFMGNALKNGLNTMNGANKSTDSKSFSQL